MVHKIGLGLELMPKQDLIFLELVPKQDLILNWCINRTLSHVPKIGLSLMCLKQDLVPCA